MNKGYRLLEGQVWPGESVARPPQTNAEISGRVQYWLSGGRFQHSGSEDVSDPSFRDIVLHFI